MEQYFRRDELGVCFMAHLLIHQFGGHYKPQVGTVIIMYYVVYLINTISSSTIVFEFICKTLGNTL